MTPARGTEKQVRILRAAVRDDPSVLGRLAQAIGNAGGKIGDIVRVRATADASVRDVELYLDSDAQLQALLAELEHVDGVQVERVYDPVFEVHRQGKIRMRSTVPVDRISDVRKIYTPGVATVCLDIHAHPAHVYDFTALGHTVAIVTNGTAILGLGNIGAQAGLPVMEGKAVLLDRLVGLSGIPILLNTRDSKTFVDTVIEIAPSFGAIQIEDVAAPECFEIEDRLTRELPIPVMHDDQHGTAVVVLAALLNIAAQTGRDLRQLTVGLIGLGAAGIGIARLLTSFGVKQLVGTDIKQEARQRVERLGARTAELDALLEECDGIVATTGRPGLIGPRQIRPGQIVLALSNPQPEIEPAAALRAGAAFAADGRSVNNALAFPGIFRGALDARARRIDGAMKLAAAEALARLAEPGEILPSLLSLEVHQAVADAVAGAAGAPPRREAYA